MRLSTAQAAKLARLEPSGSSYVVRGIPGKLAQFVERHWGGSDLNKFAEATPEKRDREMLVSFGGDSKALATNPFHGVFIRSFGGCYLRGHDLGITPSGSALIITRSELPELRVETRYLIGIENVECLWKFEKARKHFPLLADADFTLVLRWHWGSTWQQWLESWQGQFLYFPDYDPSGLSIFASAILPHQPDARLLIPENFETILAGKGKRPLYLKQEKFLPITCEHIDVIHVSRALKIARKALEQEYLLL